MNFIKGTIIIFVIHFIVVLGVCAVVTMSYDSNIHAQNEAHLLWYIFYTISFPLGLLFHPVGILFHKLFPICAFEDYIWSCVVLPACAMQILGWVNWTIIFVLFFMFRKQYEKAKRYE
jgi:hypothetical protein